MTKKMMRPDAEIQAEISTLKEIKSKVRKETAFGDDNHAAIDAQLSVLEDKLTLDQVHDRFQDDDDDGDVFNEHSFSAALEAYDWMWQQSDDESPSEGWSSFSNS